MSSVYFILIRYQGIKTRVTVLKGLFITTYALVTLAACGPRAPSTMSNSTS